MNLSQRGAPLPWLLLGLFFVACTLGLLAWAAFGNSQPLPQDGFSPETLLLLAAICALLGVASVGYSVYLLRSARAARSTPLTLTPVQLQTALRMALDFTSDDLQANRMGLLSERQLAKLGRSMAWARGCGMVVSVLLLVGFLGMLGYIFFVPPIAEQTRASLSQGPGSALLLAVPLGSIFLLILRGVGRTLRHNRPLGERRVEQVEGTVMLRIYDTRYGSSVLLRVGGRRFYLTLEQALGFWNGGSYRLYYLPAFSYGILLSGEVLM